MNPETTKKVKEKMEILEVVQVFSTLELKKTGNIYKTHCPFHEERTASFSINPTRQRYKCYGCGASGDAIAFLMEYLNVDFKEAIALLANHYNINIEKTTAPAVKKHEPRFKVKKMSAAELEAAQKQEDATIKKKVYAIRHTPKKEATAYLKQRGIKTETLPANAYFYSKSYKTKTGRTLPGGVVFLDKTKSFINKRHINADKETPKMHNKGALQNKVYDASYIAQKEHIYITEGVINALSFRSIGESAIATFSTGNQYKNLNTLKPYINNKHIILATDTDKAGLRYAIKLASQIQNDHTIQYKGLEILLFPDGKDGNDLLAQNQLKKHLKEKANYYPCSFDLIANENQKLKNTNYIPALTDPNYSTRALTHNEKAGTWQIQEGTVSDAHLHSISPNTCADDIEMFNIVYLNSYTVFEEKAHIFTSSGDNPIFYLKDHKTIWRPLPKANQNQFVFLEEKEFIFNKKRLYKIHDQRSEEMLEDESAKKQKTPKALESIILCDDIKDVVALKEENCLCYVNMELTSKELQEYKNMCYHIYMIPHNTAASREQATSKALKHVGLKIIDLPKYLKSAAELDNHSIRKLKNTARSFKFWQMENKEYTINAIYLRNFLEVKGFFTIENPLEKQNFQYIKIDGKTVEKKDKEGFERLCRRIADNFLLNRGESPKLRDKLARTPDFSERVLGGLQEVNLDFVTGDNEKQYWFFSDNTLWEVDSEKIKHLPQSTNNKYVWSEDLIKLPSTVQEPLFQIFETAEYLELKEEVARHKKNSPEWRKARHNLNKLPTTKKYDIKISAQGRQYYFLQFLWLTGAVYWEKIEQKKEIEPDMFWYGLEDILESEEIQEMKLHLINKIVFLGYFMKDHRNMDEDFGGMLLDMLDLENTRNKGAAGGGKSLITKAIRQVKRTLILKAEAENWADYAHRYAEWDGERIIVADDMHSQGRIGNLLTDLSEGIEVNKKHKDAKRIPFEKSPKMLFTRNFLDVEGERVDRRLWRAFVGNFFHDNKSGVFKTRRTPKDFFGKTLYQQDTEAEKNLLVNFFANCFQNYQKHGVINPPMSNLERNRMVLEIGMPLIDFLDEYFTLENNYGLIEKKPLYDLFINEKSRSFSPYEKTKIYSSVRQFKERIAKYCELRSLIYNPDELINDRDRNRIKRQSQIQPEDANGRRRTAEYLFIAPPEIWEDQKINFISENNEASYQEDEDPF